MKYRIAEWLPFLALVTWSFYMAACAVRNHTELEFGMIELECDRCGRDVSKDDLRELVEELQDKEIELSGANERVEGYEYARKRLEMVLDE